MLRLDRAQLVEQRVVLVVADLGVVEDVVAVAVVMQLLAQLRGAFPGAPGSLHFPRGRREQPAEVVALQRVHARRVGEVEVQRRDGDPAGRDGRQVRAGLVVEAVVGAVDPVAPAAGAVGSAESVSVSSSR